MTNKYVAFDKCKNPDCNFKSNEMSDYDDEGYCLACSEIKSEMQREAAN